MTLSKNTRVGSNGKTHQTHHNPPLPPVERVVETSPETVYLKPGLNISADALHLAWDFENRGLTVDLDSDDRLVVLPEDEVTSAEWKAVARHRGELVCLVRQYREVVV